MTEIHDAIVDTVVRLRQIRETLSRGEGVCPGGPTAHEALDVVDGVIRPCRACGAAL